MNAFKITCCMILIVVWLGAASHQAGANEHPGAADTVIIKLRPSTTLDAKRNVLLEDIAEISGPGPLVARLKNIVIGRAPLPGYTRGIHVGYIKVRLRQAGIKEDKLRFVFEHPRLEVKTAKQEKPLALAPQEPVSPLSSDAASNGGDTYALVAMRDINYREKLHPGLFELKRVQGKTADLIAVVKPEDWDHLRAARFIAAGDILTKTACERIPAVEQGTQVQLIVRYRGITVKAPGIALTSGEIGEIVEVANTSSGKKVQGTVVGKQTVEVDVL